MCFASCLSVFACPDVPSAFLPVAPSAHVSTSAGGGVAVNSSAPANSAPAPTRADMRNTYEKPSSQKTHTFTSICQADRVMTSQDADRSGRPYVSHVDRSHSCYDDDEYFSYVSKDNSSRPQLPTRNVTLTSRPNSVNYGDASNDATAVEITYNPAFSPIYEDIPALPPQKMDVSARSQAVARGQAGPWGQGHARSNTSLADDNYVIGR